jgi:hypothetical protein
MKKVVTKCDQYNVFVVLCENKQKAFKKYILMEVTSAALFISVSLMVFGISYYYFTTRNKERMAILEKGLSPDFFKGDTHFLPLILTLGIVSIGISLGIVVGSFLSSIDIEGAKYIMLPFSIFLFLGISLVVSYYVLKSIQRKQ